MFGKPRKPTTTPTQRKRVWQPKDEWYVSKLTLPDKIDVYLANDLLMDRTDENKGIEADKAVLFGSVMHQDPDFERKWATLLSKANRRVDVLNKGFRFTLDEIETSINDGKSLCGNCSKEFDGEDYLCPDCRE